MLVSCELNSKTQKLPIPLTSTSSLFNFKLFNSVLKVRLCFFAFFVKSSFFNLLIKLWDAAAAIGPSWNVED